MAFNWKCPHCAHAQTVGPGQLELYMRKLQVAGHPAGDIGLQSHSIICSNKDCRQLTLAVAVVPCQLNGNVYRARPNADWLLSRTLLPDSAAKPQPDCIPAPLIEDYREACLIAELSPKASATLSRRCLQGMIRDFCGISRATLDQEIKALRAALDEGTAPPGVTAEAVDGIDHVRQVGNIGAHMEKDIDLIVPVDPGEAKALIALVEMLFEEWYVARDQRKKRFAAIAAIATEKKAIKAAPVPKPVALLAPQQDADDNGALASE